MKEIIKNLKVGLTIGVGFVVMVSLAGIVYGAWTNISSLKVNSNDLLSSSTWNEAMDNFELLRNSQSVPAGLVSAFNLDACPTGWKAADGLNDTPDLRGVFIRGLNNFGTGERNDGYEDKDKDISGMNRILGSLQYDTMRPITGTSQVVPTGMEYKEGAFGNIINRNSNRTVNTGGGWYYASLTIDSSLLGPNFSGSDTHPKNIALIYCVKE